MTRVLLLTGKGGVGKSTVAAGTAALSAATGRRTLVLSTDAAHSLADALGLDAPGLHAPGADPVEIEDDLWLQQVDAQARFEQSWAEIQGYLLSVLEVAGVDPVAAEELAVLPGAEEVLALLELREQVLSGEWDVVVVDCAPTAETLRLLALPEALGWYMQRVFPAQRRIVKALKPVLTRAAGAPMPGDSVFDAIQRLHGELEEVRDLLSGPEASVRIVLTPERVVLAEARRSWTTLSLYGYRVDGVVANRVFPDAGADEWRQGWVAAQQEVLASVEESFAGLPVWRSGYRAQEPVGVVALRAVAEEMYAGVDALARPTAPEPFRVTQTRTGPLLHLSLPHAQREDVDLVRHGDELVVTVASYRRMLALPASLAHHRVSGAGVVDGELRVRFAGADTDDERAGER